MALDILNYFGVDSGEGDLFEYDDEFTNENGGEDEDSEEDYDEEMEYNEEY